jgi:hypothetical protein
MAGRQKVTLHLQPPTWWGLPTCHPDFLQVNVRGSAAAPHANSTRFGMLASSMGGTLSAQT